MEHNCQNKRKPTTEMFFHRKLQATGQSGACSCNAHGERCHPHLLVGMLLAQSEGGWETERGGTKRDEREGKRGESERERERETEWEREMERGRGAKNEHERERKLSFKEAGWRVHHRINKASKQQTRQRSLIASF